jgi:uncharacterized membrane protein
MKAARMLRHLFTPTWLAQRAFPAAALAGIEKAVGDSERRHAGQIRFAVEAALHPAAIWRGVSAADRALEVFSSLRVWDTEHNNGVLVYLLLADHDVEIVADRGIHARVGSEAWEAICRAMEGHFRAGRFEQGVIEGIGRITALLEAHFPRASGANELPDRPVVL